MRADFNLSGKSFFYQNGIRFKSPFPIPVPISKEERDINFINVSKWKQEPYEKVNYQGRQVSVQVTPYWIHCSNGKVFKHFSDIFYLRIHDQEAFAESLRKLLYLNKDISRSLFSAAGIHLLKSIDLCTVGFSLKPNGKGHVPDREKMEICSNLIDEIWDRFLETGEVAEPPLKQSVWNMKNIVKMLISTHNEYTERNSYVDESALEELLEANPGAKLIPKEKPKPLPVESVDWGNSAGKLRLMMQNTMFANTKINREMISEYMNVFEEDGTPFTDDDLADYLEVTKRTIQRFFANNEDLRKRKDELNHKIDMNRIVEVCSILQDRGDKISNRSVDKALKELYGKSIRKDTLAPIIKIIKGV